MRNHSIYITIFLLFVSGSAWSGSSAKSASEFDPIDVEDFIGLMGFRDETFVEAFAEIEKDHLRNEFSEAPDMVQAIIEDEMDRAFLNLFQKQIKPAVVELVRKYFSPDEITGFLDGNIETLKEMPAFQQAVRNRIKTEIKSTMKPDRSAIFWAAVDLRLIMAGYQRSQHYYMGSGAAALPKTPDSIISNLASGHKYASSAEIPSAAFVQDTIGGVLLSDDGEHVALLYPDEDRYQILIRRTDDPGSSGLEHSRPLRNHLHEIQWLSNNSLILDRKGSSFRFIENQFVNDAYHRVSTIEIGIPKMVDNVSIDHQSAESFAFRTIVDLLPSDPDHILIAWSPDGKNYPGVYKLHLPSGEFNVVQPSRRPIRGWWSDINGAVRLGVGVEDEKLVVIARAGVDLPWDELSNNKTFQPGMFDIVSFDPDPSLVLVRSPVNSGRSEIFRMSLESGRLTEKVFAHPKVDAADIVVSRRDQRLLAVGFVEDEHRYRYYDSDFAASMQHVDQALPGRSHIIRSISSDDNFLLIYSVSGTHPGSFYRFDRSKQSLTLIADNNPLLDSDLLAPVQAVTYFARDGLEIPAYVTTPKSRVNEALPAIVMPHDINQGRNVLEFDFIAQFLASRGYLVIQPNYRGSTGYGAAFQELGRGQWGDQMQSDLADAALFLVDNGMADPDRICSAGWSYGGYAALMSVIQDPDIFACAIAVAPITNIKTTLKAVRAAGGDMAVQSLVGDRSGKKLRAISPIEQVKTLKRPLLILHGTKDGVVPYSDSLAFVKKLIKYKKPYKSVRLKEADHVLSNAEHRAALLNSMEEFLSRYIGEPTP